MGAPTGVAPGVQAGLQKDQAEDVPELEQPGWVKRGMVMLPAKAIRTEVSLVHLKLHPVEGRATEGWGDDGAEGQVS